MIRRHWPAGAIAICVLAIGLTLQGQEPAGLLSPKDLAARQQQLETQYKAFIKNLVALKQKLAQSDRLEDRAKAETLEKAIAVADKEAIDNRFAALIRTLNVPGELGISELTTAKSKNEEIIVAMEAILRYLTQDDELTKLQEERKLIEQLLKELNGIIRDQGNLKARTESNRGDNDRLAKEQEDLKDRTDALATKAGAKPSKESKGKPAGESKPGEGKENAGEGKEDTAQDKGEEKEGKPGMGEPMPGDPMAGEPRDSKGPMEGMGGEPKGGSKPMDGMGDPMMGGSKGMGEPKMGGGDPMMGGGDPKMGGGDPMMGGDKESAKKDPAEKRNKEDNKGEQKGSASEQAKKDPMMGGGEPKAGEKSDGMGSEMAGGSKGSPSQSPPSSGGGSPPPPGGGSEQQPGGEEVAKAVPDEENAASNLEKGNRDQAAKDQTEAEKKLETAKKELEERLRQLREKELERLLANLEQRVNKMLTMQMEVKAATEAIAAQVEKNPDMKPTTGDYQNSQAQEDKEKEIIEEADKAIRVLQSEGSAVAFPQVFEEVRIDMVRVAERLHDVRVGKDTQGIEQDIIDALTLMREALKKAQQELGQKPPPPGGGGGGGGQQDQKLLDELAELKMIRQLQIQVNSRTKRHGEAAGGEQAEDKQIKKEIIDLSNRQQRIESMINDIVTKKNQ
ncbi:MAG: hypothetical protein R3B84_18225 [Zavarzinella sp.]